MGKLSSLPTRAPAASVATSPVADTRTSEGARGYSYDDRSALFLLAMTNMVGEDTFYEGARARDDRFSMLVRRVAQADPDWLLAMIGWLRAKANMRSASIVAAVEAAHFTKGTEYPRRFLAAALQRADEPAEALGFWLAKYGRPIPTWLKRGLADAADRLYSEFSALKYDGAGQPIRFADVIELSDARHLGPSTERDALWVWLLDRRHGHDDVKEIDGLPMIRAREALDEAAKDLRSKGSDVAVLLDADRLRGAGHTWESVATLLNGPWTARAWEAVIPSMGYMALLRNLRNFDQAGISASVAKSVAERLADPYEVARSKQLPMRFLSAYRAVENDRWKPALSDALQSSLGNVPTLDGETLVLIDTSGSMSDAIAGRDSTLKRWDAAAIFGIAFAYANGLDEVQSFSTGAKWMPIPRGASLLNLVERFRSEFFLNGGTATGAALREAHARHPEARRALVLTDEQASRADGSVLLALDAITAGRGYSFTFNLAGYRQGMAPTGSDSRHYTLGGLTDQAFALMDHVERGRDQRWPWTV